MNVFQKMARATIKRSFKWTVSLIEWCSDMHPYHQKVAELRTYSENTLGHQIAKCLDENDLTLVPKYESHDLKHVLLEYEMTPEGEIRLQAFMVGNGNVSVPSLAILIYGALLLPDLWKTLYTDLKKGRNSIPLSNWTIEMYAHCDLNELKCAIEKPVAELKPSFDMKRITKIGAITSLFAGVFGMLFCLPFLFSSNMADLVGAGFPFVGGAILAVGGLLSLSMQTKARVQSN